MNVIWAPTVPDRRTDAQILDRPAVFTLTRRVLLAGPSTHDLADHWERYGPRPPAGGPWGDRLVGTLSSGWLTGRGGAHFPVARKWQAARAGGGVPVVIGNAAEGEPASAKDAAVVRCRPHLVLDGTALAAEAVGASRTMIWLHHGDLAARNALTAALAERRLAGLPDPPVAIRFGPAGYLTGESSAVLSAVSGGPPRPVFRGRPAATVGVAQPRGLVHNVETLARVALAARLAPSAQTALVTVTGGRHRTVLELPEAMTLAQVLNGVQPDGRAVQAVLLGGYSGTWVTWERAADLRVSDLIPGSAALSLGAGVIVPLPWDACGLRVTAELAGFLARNSAGQCGPCLFGLPAIAHVLDRLVDGEATRRDMARLRRYVGEVEGRGACHHPDGAARLVRSCLVAFAEDAQLHLRRRRCSRSQQRITLPLSGA